MKELSIEEKAKACDEVVERAKKVLLDCTPEERKVVEYIFPELKESEDEKIRKDITSFVEQAIDTGYGIISKERKEKWIAWLKKQGNLMKALQISNAKIGKLVEKNYYLKEQLEKQGTDISSFPKEQQMFMQKYVSLDKITLIKILAERDANNTEIIESFEKQGEQPKKHDICDYCDQQGNCVSPCCVKLVEKNDEHKPVEIPSFKIGETITDGISTFTIVDIVDGHYVADDGDKVSFYVVHRYYTIIQNWETQNPTWSKEDEEICRKCICTMTASASGFPEEEKFVEQVNNWFKSLKNRVQPQLKQEWSEEDEKMYNLIHDLAWEGYKINRQLGIPTFGTINDWFKSIKDKYIWKPSDEQMEALWNVYRGGKEQAELATLYNDLKKLRKE